MTSTRRYPRRRLRVMTYNVLLGASRREDLVSDVVRRAGADVVALQEVRDPALAERIGRDLRMSVHIGRPSDSSDLNLAVLSRLPVIRSRNHRHPGAMLRSHLEVEVASRAGGADTVVIHCVHLAARFGERANGEVRRMREMRCVLTSIRHHPARPHLITGDFNAIAPGDGVAATAFLRRMTELRRSGLVVRRGDGFFGPRLGHGDDPDVDEAWRRAGVDPRLEVGIPMLPAVVGPLTARLPHSPRLDQILTRRIDRRTVQHLLDEGYRDCYRELHPRARGYTCATWMPAARIDYVFASEEMADALIACDVVGSRELRDPSAFAASDHFPLVADFRA